MRAHVDADAVVAATAALVGVDTQNPPGDERAALPVARDLLAGFGARFEEVEPAPGRASLLATIGAADGSRPVLLVNGHLDVVPVDRAGWTHDPFGGEVVDGRLYGRGTADMKGGIAAAVEALAALRRAGREPACDLVFHLVADEELGGALGTAVLVAEGRVRADACLVPEPTGMALCVAERGLLTTFVTVHGRPAHGSEPRRGVSAVEKAAKVVLALHGADFGGPEHPLLGRPTCNVGVIAGGSGHNIVAASCRLEADRRLLPGVTRAAAEAELRARIDAIDDAELSYDLETSVFGEASELDPGHPFVEALQASMTAVLGERQPVIGMPFATDARFVRNQAGIAAVVCGPGDLAQAHTHDESVAVDRLVDAAAVYAELYATFSG
ncbi:MAG TPA: M20 family metallopeptidase [Acidimicrobiales bacterium]|nr:M20 family metallopeptidase [Acidimicrobiales bacterium]